MIIHLFCLFVCSLSSLNDKKIISLYKLLMNFFCLFFCCVHSHFDSIKKKFIGIILFLCVCVRERERATFKYMIIFKSKIKVFVLINIRIIGMDSIVEIIIKVMKKDIFFFAIANYSHSCRMKNDYMMNFFLIQHQCIAKSVKIV